MGLPPGGVFAQECLFCPAGWPGQAVCAGLISRKNKNPGVVVSRRYVAGSRSCSPGSGAGSSRRSMTKPARLMALVMTVSGLRQNVTWSGSCPPRYQDAAELRERGVPVG